ncbi:MAG: hypothetical protein U1C74_27305 [Phenylobacterium sp.]|nr:hypothetical protein [Phenylobacterium sp.]
MGIDEIDIQLERWTYVGHKNIHGAHRMLAATFRISLSPDLPETELTVHTASSGVESEDLERAKRLFHRLTARLAAQTVSWRDPDEAT